MIFYCICFNGVAGKAVLFYEYRDVKTFLFGH